MAQQTVGALASSPLARHRGGAALLLGMALLSMACQALGSEEGASQEELSPQPSDSAKNLLEALEDLLEDSEGGRALVEKRVSQLPRCDIGERCAIRHGPRIGKLCHCLRGASCNTFLLRCY